MVSSLVPSLLLARWSGEARQLHTSRALQAWVAVGKQAAARLWPALPPLAYAPWLFNTLDHALTQPGADDLLLVVLTDARRGQVVAHWFVFPDLTVPGAARSPGRAPFGGAQFAAGLEQAAAAEFVALTRAELAACGLARGLTVALPPQAYDLAGTSRLTQELVGAGGTVRATLSYHLPTDVPFEAGLHPSARRRLRKAALVGLVFGPDGPAALPAVYGCLRAWRTQRGHELPLDERAVRALLRRFPEAFHLFSVRTAAGQRVAVVVAVRVAPDVLYYFLPASDPAFDTLSPTVTLVAGLHAWARAGGARLLDLGPALLPGGAESPSLARFKYHLGARPSLKLTVSL